MLVTLMACNGDPKVSDPRADEPTDTGDTPADTDTGAVDTDTGTPDTDTQDTDTNDTDDTDTGSVDPDDMTVMDKETCEKRFVNGDGEEKIEATNLSDTDFLVSNGAYATYDGYTFEDTNFARTNSNAPVFVCIINGLGEAAEFSTVQVIPGTDANPEQSLTIQGEGIELNGGAVTAWFMNAEPQLLGEDADDTNAPWFYSAGAGEVEDLQYMAPQSIDNQYFLVD